MVHTLSKTITLPSHCQEWLHQLLDAMLHWKQASRQEWQQLLGELCSMQLALPGSAGCFSFLQEALGANNQWVKITEPVKDQLCDFKWNASSLSSQPTHLAEVVPTPHLFWCYGRRKRRHGRGSLAATNSHKAQESHTLASALSQMLTITAGCKSVTNSNLELSGVIAHDDILVNALPSITHISTCTFSDNTPAVAWKTKGSTSTTGPATLQTAALHKRHYQYQNDLQYLPGPINVIVDDCSHLWKLTDSQLLSYFNSTYPQAVTWKLHHLRPEMLSVMISNLQTKRLPPASFLPDL